MLIPFHQLTLYFLGGVTLILSFNIIEKYIKLWNPLNIPNIKNDTFDDNSKYQKEVRGILFLNKDNYNPPNIKRFAHIIWLVFSVYCDKNTFSKNIDDCIPTARNIINAHKHFYLKPLRKYDKLFKANILTNRTNKIYHHFSNKLNPKIVSKVICQFDPMLMLDYRDPPYFNIPNNPEVYDFAVLDIIKEANRISPNLNLYTLTKIIQQTFQDWLDMDSQIFDGLLGNYKMDSNICFLIAYKILNFSQF